MWTPLRGLAFTWALLAYGVLPTCSWCCQYWFHHIFPGLWQNTEWSLNEGSIHLSRLNCYCQSECEAPLWINAPTRSWFTLPSSVLLSICSTGYPLACDSDSMALNGIQSPTAQFANKVPKPSVDFFPEQNMCYKYCS